MLKDKFMRLLGLVIGSFLSMAIDERFPYNKANEGDFVGLTWHRACVVSDDAITGADPAVPHILVVLLEQLSNQLFTLIIEA